MFLHDDGGGRRAPLPLGPSARGDMGMRAGLAVAAAWGLLFVPLFGAQAQPQSQAAPPPAAAPRSPSASTSDIDTCWHAGDGGAASIARVEACSRVIASNA